MSWVTRRPLARVMVFASHPTNVTASMDGPKPTVQRPPVMVYHPITPMSVPERVRVSDTTIVSVLMDGWELIVPLVVASMSSSMIPLFARAMDRALLQTNVNAMMDGRKAIVQRPSALASP